MVTVSLTLLTAVTKYMTEISNGREGLFVSHFEDAANSGREGRLGSRSWPHCDSSQ